MVGGCGRVGERRSRTHSRGAGGAGAGPRPQPGDETATAKRGVAEGRGGRCEIRGQRATEGAPGAAPSSGPEQSCANLNPGRAEGRGVGQQGPGGGGGNDPRRVLTRSSRVSAGRGPCGGPLGSCGSGGRSQGPGTRAGGPAGGHGVSSRAGTGRSWAIGTWGGRLAGWSSGHCRWSRGEAGSWRGIWLSCWTCMRAAGTRAR